MGLKWLTELTKNSGDSLELNFFSMRQNDTGNEPFKIIGAQSQKRSLG